MKLSTSKIWSNFPNRDIFVSLIQLATRENVQLYLVGGTVRDILLKRPIMDLDFAISNNAIEFAYKLSEQFDAVCIPLDERYDIARLIFHKSNFYMDFSGIRGPDIIADLIARDFTINAMAIDAYKILEDHDLEIMDPTDGIEDLNSSFIRLASPKSITDDPIRMLRAYRFAASLNFTIHDTVLSAINSSLDLLDFIAGERIRDELLKILGVDNSVLYLREMDELGLLERIFPEIISIKGMRQSKYHRRNLWDHSIMTLELLEQNLIPDSLANYKPEIEKYLQYESVIGRPRILLLKLAALFHDVGKPAVKIIDEEGRIHFFNHSTKGSEIFLNMGSRLRLANRETLFISNIIKEHTYPLGLSVILHEPRTAKEKDRMIRKFIQKANSELLGILMLSHADFKATQGGKKDDLKRLDKVIGDTADMYFRENMPKLITGDDIMKEFSLPASPDIGKFLKQVEDAQLDGKIKTRDEAMELIRNILSKE